MTTATLSRKGQTTIPKAVRDRLGLRPGDRVEFLVTPQGHAVLLPRNLTVADLRGRLPRPARPATVEEMNEAVAEAAASGE